MSDNINPADEALKQVQTEKQVEDSVNQALDLEKEAAASDQLAETLANLQALIERHAHNLIDVESKLKEKRQMLKNVFDNDEKLSEVENTVAEASKALKERKTQITNDGQVVSLKLQIAEVNQEKKEIEEALSNHLVNYHQLTGSTSFDTADGDQWDFSIRAKVKPKKSN